jgi:acetyl esterase/lipase
MKTLPVLIALITASILHAQEAEKSTPQPSSEQAKPNTGKPKKSGNASEGQSVPVPTHAEVRYGPHERNVLDFWQARSDKPTPLVLVIHGGGWNSGSKERVNSIVNVKALLDAGISVAANNYRLIPQAVAEGVTPPVKAPMHDSARSLQFLRSKAAEWNIDPTRVAAAGSSAGACTSLWLAYHEDLADPESADPIARQSTRLVCAAVIGAQTTLDPKQAKEWIPNSRYGGHAFGKKSFAEALADRQNILPWIADYSPYELASKDDPPVALFYRKAPSMGNKEDDPTHSANFGMGLQQRCKELGIGCDFVHPGTPNAKHKTSTEYLIRMLTAK